MANYNSRKRKAIRPMDVVKRWAVIAIAVLVIASMLLADLSYIFM
jgi:hypothetical protein